MREHLPSEAPAEVQPRLWTINGKYLAAAALLLLVEIFIALRVHDRWIRPHGGDVLVVILIYCSLRAFLNLPVVPTALGVLAFSFLVETLQYFHLVARLGLEHNRFAAIVIGSSFEWLDLVSYTLGVAMVLGYERRGGGWRSSPGHHG